MFTKICNVKYIAWLWCLMTFLMTVYQPYQCGLYTYPCILDRGFFNKYLQLRTCNVILDINRPLPDSYNDKNSS